MKKHSGKTVTVAIVWQKGPVHGSMEVVNGNLQRLALSSGKVKEATFSSNQEENVRLAITVSVTG